MAFIANLGVAPKGERYDREYLVKSKDKEYKRTEFNDFIYSSNNLDVGSIGLNKYGRAVISDVYEIFTMKDGYAPEFISELVQRPRNLHKVLRFRQGCLYGQYRIYASDFLSVKLLAPDNEEQFKIAGFLQQIDSRITAQRRLVELLKKHKRGLVQDLFTGELSKLPRRRFAGFKDALISRSFDEVFSFLKNNTLPRSEMTTAGGMIRNVHYGDVLIKYGDVLDCNRNQIPFLVDDKHSDDCRLLQDGDVVIADTAEDEAVGKAVELVGVANKLIESGLHTIACRPKIPFASRFLGYYLNSTAYRRQLLPLMQGIKVLSLSKSQLGKTQLLFPPDINEQKRIAELLTGIDAHIAVAQSHLDKMQSLKTGFLQQLFV